MTPPGTFWIAKQIKKKNNTKLGLDFQIVEQAKRKEREPWASNTNGPLSHDCYWFHLEHIAEENAAVSFTHAFLQTKDQHTDQWHQRDTFSLSLLYACYYNKPFFVVLFKRSFIIRLCCQIIYSVREINHFPKHWKFFSAEFSIEFSFSLGRISVVCFC